jgi:predicted RNase H-like HicB family nuclease
MEKFTAVFEQDGEWWIGYLEELPGANTQGRTLGEARENLKDAVRLLIGIRPTVKPRPYQRSFPYGHNEG